MVREPRRSRPQAGAFMRHARSKAPLGAATLATLVAVALSAPAADGLGGDAASVIDDGAHLQGQLISTRMPQFERHDITTGPGAVIHEYLAPGGSVFAVSWQGPMPPDLRQLFGSYFETFRSAAAARSHPGGHRQLSIVEPDFILQAIGRTRAFRGLAYVPSLVPTGVNIAELP